MAAITPVAVNKSSYAELRRKVEEVLLQGQRKIEEAKVLTYWTAGKLIHEHVLQYKGRAEHGSRVIQKLASDLEVSRRLIYQTLKFYEAFPILHARAELGSVAAAPFADLFIPKEEEFIFVNQRLLDEGLAVRVKE